MIVTPKHQKVLALAGTKTGCSIDIYGTEAGELSRAGQIERREHMSAVGTRSLRWFLKREIG